MQSESNERPLVCRLDAFTKQQAKRHAALWARIQRRAEGIEELDSGYALRFPLDNELLIQLAEFIILERLCCPFLDFGLELFPERESIQLRLSGGGGVKAFLQQELQAMEG